MNRITRDMGLSFRDRELAAVTALLHDIGRFEQLRLYDSFEPSSMDHAAYGVEILFGQGKIRDADKMDNCRVKLEEPVEAMLGASKEEVGSTPISPGVYEEVMAGRCLRLEDRKTKADYWVSYLAYFYDIYFPETMKWILEEDMIRRIADRIPYSNPGTKEKMEKIVERVQAYAEQF